MLGWFRSHRAVIRSPTWRRVACEADFLREEVHPLLFHTLSPSLEPHKWQRNAAAASRPQGAETASALPRPQFPSAPPGAGEAAGRLVAGITGWHTRPGKSPPAARRKPNPVFQRRWADHAQPLLNFVVSPRQGTRPQRRPYAALGGGKREPEKRWGALCRPLPSSEDASRRRACSYLV